MIHQYKHITLLLLLFIAISSSGQYRSEKLRIAENLESTQKFYEAIDAYQEAIKENATLHEVKYKLAVLNDNMGDLNEAIRWYEDIVKNHIYIYPRAEYQLALIYKRQGHYEKAIHLFKEFLKFYNGYDKSAMNKKAKSEIEGCEMALSSVSDSSYVVRSLSEINSTYTDLSPIILGDSIYFSTIPTDSALTYADITGPENFFELRSAKWDMKTDSVVSPTKKFGNSSWAVAGENISGGTFSSDSNRFYFSKCTYNDDGKNICKIYGATKTKKGWSDAILLEINDVENKFSTTHPTVITSVKRKKVKDLIYFSSDRPGGSGGFDLWKVEVDANFKGVKTKNLGGKVNSAGNDITPFFSATDKTLYYSSDGLQGFGGYDVYQLKTKGRRFEKPIHMDGPINSSYDDFYYHQINEYKALLVSNRNGAKKYHKNFILDDIFVISKPSEKHLIVNTFVKDTSVIPIDNVPLEITVNDTAKFNSLNNKAILVQPNSTYSITSAIDGYINASLKVEITKISQDTTYVTLTIEKIVEEKEIRLNNIYFAFDSDVLTDSSKLELDSLLTMFADNPNMIVEIGAHTDNKGNAKYNLKLSQKRAKSVVNYLSEKGVSDSLILAKGYGMSAPIAPNNNEDGSDNPMGRQLNRRIVFKIIGMRGLTGKNDSTLTSQARTEIAIVNDSNNVENTKTTPVLAVDSTVVQSVEQVSNVLDTTINVPSIPARKDSISNLTPTHPTGIAKQDTTPLLEDSIIKQVIDSSLLKEYFISFPIDASPTKNRFRWLRKPAAQKIINTATFTIDSLRIIVKKKTGIKFKVRVVKAKNGKVVHESREFTIDGMKTASVKAFQLFDFPLGFTLEPGKYFIYPVITKGEIAHLGNFTKENSFNDGTIIIGAPMFNNQTMDKGKFKFKLKEEKSGRLKNYGPFFRFVLSFP